MTATLHHVSASQVETFDLCNRKWFFKSIMKLPTPEGAGAKLGKEVHASFEAYLNNEISAFDLHPLARRVFERGLVPSPGQVWVEHAIPHDAILVAGVAMIGFIDVLDLKPFDDTGVPLVTDWKTRGDLKYAKGEDELLEDVQANVYAAETFRVLDQHKVGGDTVLFRHVNIGTRAPNAVQVAGPVRLTRAGVAAFFERRLVPTVERMKVAAFALSPFRVTPNVKACASFGGCPFRDKCKAIDAVSSISTTTPGVSTVSTTQSKDSIMTRLRNNTADAPAASPAVNANPVRPPDAPASGAKAALLARLNGAKAEDVTKPAAPVPQAAKVEAAAPKAEATERKPRGHDAKLAELNYDAGQVGRMQAGEMRRVIEGKIDGRGVSVSADGIVTVIPPKPAAVAAKFAGDEGPNMQDLDSCVKYAIDVLGWSDAEMDATPDELLVFVAGKKVARATVDIVWGEDGKVADLTEKPAAPAPARVSQAVIEGALATREALEPVVEGLVLYIGCRPVKGEHRKRCGSLEAYLRPLQEAVAKDAKVEHYTMIDYAQGPARVAALVLRDPPVGIFTVDRTLPGTAAVLEVLLPLADSVIVAGG